MVTSRFTFSIDATLRDGLLVALGCAVCVAAFLLLVGLGPGRLPYPPGSQYSDAVTSHWPNAFFLRRAVLDEHAFPLWRPLLMSGQPFAANPLNKVWYPLQWLVLLLSPVTHLNLMVWLHLVAGGTGTWVWSRETGLQPWAALLAAGGYVFAPRVIAALGAGHLDLVYAAGWLPWLVWSVHRMTVAAEVRARFMLLSAVFAALVVLADVRLGAYALALAVAYFLWRWWTYRSQEHAPAAWMWHRAAVVAWLVAGFTAPLWVGLLLYRADLSRGAMTLDDAAVSSLSPGQWIGLLIGDHGGAWESMVYVGVSTLALALVTLAWRPRQFGFWWGVVLFAALYAMGDHFPLWVALNRAFPLLRWWRVPPRAWLIAAWVLPYLAAWGAQLLVTGSPPGKAARLGVVALFGGGMACGVFSVLALSAYLKPAATLGTFALPAVALIMLLVLHRRLAGRAALIAFALIVLVDVLWLDRSLVEGRHKREWLDPHAELADHLQDAGATRVYSPSYSLPQHAAMYWGIPLFGGVDPFQNAAYVAAFEAATGVTVDGYSVTLPPYDLADNGSQDDTTTGDDGAITFAEVLRRANRDAPLRPDLLAQWRVSHVLAAFPLDVPGLVLDAQIGDVFVYRNALLPESRVQWDGPNRVTVQVPAGFEGPLYAVANGRWQDAPAQAVMPGLPGPVEEAPHTWTYTYDPAEIRYGLMTLAACVVLAALVGWRGLRA